MIVHGMRMRWKLSPIFLILAVHKSKKKTKAKGIVKSKLECPKRGTVDTYSTKKQAHCQIARELGKMLDSYHNVCILHAAG